MITIKLTHEEAKFIRDHMKLAAMNETGHAAETAEQIVSAIEPELKGSQLFREIRNIFADLYPEGRE